MTEILNYINGNLCPSQNDLYLENYNPATGEIYSRCPDSTVYDIELAVESAKKAFPLWSNLSMEDRMIYLCKIADRIDEKIFELAEAETIDTGKPITLSKNIDIPRAATNFRFFAGAANNFCGESFQTSDSIINYTLRKPIGVVGCISPWNLPIYLFSWKIAPALATGNCVIAKPSELTPMTAYLLSKICIDIKLPPGVLNIVHGSGDRVGNAIVKNQDIAAISFTGGTETGKTILKSCAENFKKTSLEMGGKNPAIVYADCDLNKTIKSLIRASFTNQGQICLCSSRIFIEKKIYDKFKIKFVEKTKELVVGDPMDEKSNLGAVISNNHLKKILGYINLAKQEGGIILCGGNSKKINSKNGGWYVEPTVIEGLSNSSRVNQEEIFGPVVTLIPFNDEQDVLNMSNNSIYGLSATIWTNDNSKAHRTAEKLEVGVIWINCWLIRDLRTPFGGMKSSGMGREGGLEILRFFTEPKNICFTTK